MIAYKLVRKAKDGRLYPLFIDKKKPTPIGEWLNAECHPTKGFAVRRGWHCTPTIYNAPHLKKDLANGEHRVWIEVEIEDYEPYMRSEAQGGMWFLAQRMKVLREIG